MLEATEELKKRILILNEQVWEQRVKWPKIEQWLANFTGKVADQEVEKLHALYWLSQFMYFGGREIRVLLHALYRDLYLCPMIQDIRDRLGESVPDDLLAQAIKDEIKHTCFIGVGNPSESGVHLLYYFRQENGLSKKRFLDAVQIFTRSPPTNSNSNTGLLQQFVSWISSLKTGRNQSSEMLALRHPQIRRYVFLDDICGSGDTAIDYSRLVLKDLFKLNPNAKAFYYCLFATNDGLNNIRRNTLFGKNCAAVYELDASYRCLSAESRYLKNVPSYIDPDIARQIAIEYGEMLNPHLAFGYKDSQMLMGFHHNTPDNTIGIMWLDESCGASCHWSPIFKRYPKIYGEANT
jgi:hypothetical protein